MSLCHNSSGKVQVINYVYEVPGLDPIEKSVFLFF